MLTNEECIQYKDFVIKHQDYVYPLITAKIRKYIDFNSNKLIVDLGTGPGYLTKQLAIKTNLKVHAIDINTKMLELAKELIDKNGLSKKVEYYIQDVHNLSYQDNSVDYIVSYSCIHHWVEPVRGLQECFRVLKPGGKIIIIDTHPKSLLALEHLRDYIEPEYLPILEEAFEESYSEKHVSEMIEKAGGKEYEIKRFNFEPEDFLEVIDELNDIPEYDDTPKNEVISWIAIIDKK